MINAQGDAALKMVGLPPKAGTNHEALLRNGFKATQGEVTRGQVNGFPATHFQGKRQAANGQAQAFEATLVTGPQQRVYALAYLAADAAARQRALPALNNAEKSFRALSATDRRNARPWQLEVVRFPAGGFAELERRSAHMPQADRQLRLLNGLYGGQSPLRPGDWVKVVVERP
ncbi:MAG: hypothetical protein R3E42_14585 [Burkholderiaceae bacterium]